jgi:hypothetical protein
MTHRPYKFFIGSLPTEFFPVDDSHMDDESCDSRQNVTEVKRVKQRSLIIEKGNPRMSYL